MGRVPGETEETGELINLNDEIEKYNVSVKLRKVTGWLGEIPILREPALVLNKPQSGKTRGIIRSFLNTARKGWVLIYGVSSHSEAGSVVKHYVDYQRENGWRNETLLVVAAGINRYCPHYPLIKKLREEKGDFRQTKFCKKNCKLWNTRIPERLLQPVNLLNYGEGNRKIIMTPFSYRVLARHYKKTAEDASRHIIVVGSTNDLEKVSNENILKIEGCIRPILLKKSIDTTSRNPNGTFNSKKRRKSLFAGPTIIVAPHELIPLLLSFARAYSRKVLLVIDEFDRMLAKKIPRYLAERFEKSLGKPRGWAWYKVLVSYSSVDEVDEKLIKLTPMLVRFERIILEKDEYGRAVRSRLMEVPLLAIVTRKLVELREKGKLKNIIVVGSSIPLLPMQVQRYLVKWMGYLTGKRTVAVYYSDISLPEKRMIVLFRTDVDKLKLILWTIRKGDAMVVTGTLEDAVMTALSLLVDRMEPVKRVEFRQLVDSVTFDKWVRAECKKAGGEYSKTKYICRIGRRHIVYIPIWVKGRDDYYYISGTMIYVLNVPKTYINLGRVKITWLGGRQMRGVMLPPNVRVLFFMTRGKYIEETETAFGKERVEKYRLSDLLQAIFRINSKEDVIVVMDTRTKLLLQLVQKIYSWQINQLAYI